MKKFYSFLIKKFLLFLKKFFNKSNLYFHEL